jgi:hypothetical protein
MFLGGLRYACHKNSHLRKVNSLFFMTSQASYLNFISQAPTL